MAQPEKHEVQVEGARPARTCGPKQVMQSCADGPEQVAQEEWQEKVPQEEGAVEARASPAAQEVQFEAPGPAQV